MTQTERKIRDFSQIKNNSIIGFLHPEPDMHVWPEQEYTVTQDPSGRLSFRNQAGTNTVVSKDNFEGWEGYIVIHTPRKSTCTYADLARNLTSDLCDPEIGYGAASELAHNYVEEAMALGVEEQRRKDAEIAGYVAPDTRAFFEKSVALHVASGMSKKQNGRESVPVYYSPANVAALEARVKVLEDHAAVALSYLTEAPAPAQVRGAVDTLRAALTREGGE